MKYVMSIFLIYTAIHVYLLQEAKDDLHKQVRQLEEEREVDIEDCKMKLFYDKQINRIEGCQDGMAKACQDLSNFDTIACTELLVKYCNKEE